MNILDKIVEKTKDRVKNLDEKKIKETPFSLENCFSFQKALSSDGIKIIAEIKKASPSKGIISEDFDPEKIAFEYKLANVDCISVLTEPFFFMGNNSYIQIAKNASNKPILRKDFIIDAIQIYEAKMIQADCILLICAILDERRLKNFLEIARSLGLSALVEAHNEDEIKMALDSGAEIIGVNNRNLKTFEIDFNNALKLRKMVPSDKIFVSESGIKTRQDIIKLEDAGVDAVLIGETFMKAENKQEKINNLRGI